MKIFKNILLGYLAIHVLFMLIVGFSSFSNFSSLTDMDTYNRLNPAGKLVVDQTDLITVPKPATDFIFFYSIYTGTNRGYSFFSPNISSVKVDMIFMADGKEVELPFVMQESKLKFSCANLHLHSRLFDVEERDIILKSISSSIFSNNPGIQELDIYFDLYRYQDLQTVIDSSYMVKNKKILGFSVRNNKRVAMETTTLH